MSVLGGAVSARGLVRPVLGGTTYAPTRNQLNIWLGQAATPELPVFNELTVFVLDGPIDRDLFDRALQVTIDGTDALRTVVELDGALPRMRVRDRFGYRSAFLDLTDAADPDAALDQWSRRHVDTVLDLSDRLFESTLIRLHADRYAWAILHHHVVSDGASMALVFERVGDWYARLSAGEQPAKVRYPTFVEQVRRDEELRAGPRYQRIESFWQERLRDPAEPMVFYDGLSLTAGMGHARVHQEVHLDPARARALRGLAARDGIRFLSDDLSFFGVVAGALFVMLYRISGEPRRTIGAPWHNRTKAVADTVGLVMEQDPFTVTLADDDTFASVIGKVQREALAVVRHLPYAAGNPGGRLYDVVLNVLKVVVGPFAGLPVEPRWYRPGYGEGSLLVAVHDFVGSGDLVLGFDFNAQLFTSEQRDAMIELFLHVLDECVQRPDGRITDFEVLSDSERRRIDTWNSTRREHPGDATTLDLIEAQARRRPTAVAARSGDDVLTYAALVDRVTALGAHLRAVGAGPGTFVGVCLHRSVDLLVAVLAVMRSGAAYVPLDPAFPADRLAFMLGDCGASILLTQRDLDGAVDPAGCVVVEIDEVDLAPDPHPAAGAVRPGPDDLAYVLYTSGSTGRPKGVEIPHRALTNLLRSMAEAPGCDEQDVLLAVTTLSFDISALELFLPLLCGGQVEIASRGLAADGRRLRERLDRGGITLLQATPATWRMLLEAGWQGTAGLTALIGGEPLPPDLVAPLLDRTDALWNMYGPTETTVWSSAERVARADQPITVGRPIANTTFQVLDSRGRRTPIGVAGELVIGGAGVAAGYHGRPELTADRFVPDSFSDTPGARAYRTGDLVRFQADGRVVHLGRLDTQVKVRGFRIELGEIESRLVEHPAIAQAVVDVRSDGAAGPALVAYCRPEDGDLPPVRDLRQHLRTTLPDYMVPARFVVVDEVPLTPNGKVDRRALPDPDPADLATDGHRVGPRTPVEHRLAELWAQLLGTDRIGVHDDFFDLGGHSLLALQLLNAIVDELDVELPLHRLFGASTIAALAEVIEEATGAAPSGAMRFVPELTSLWCEVLGLDEVGPDDDFLVLQADRSLVDEMLVRTRERLGVFAEGLSAADFLRRPTIRGLAELIGRNEEPVSSLVVPLRTTGEATPLFLVHAGGGYVFFYRALAAALDGRRPVYAIRAENPRDGLGRPLVAAESIASVAARYIEQIRAVQPHGPYLLGGACFGGLVAFDMARQLRAQGEQIAGPLFLFDAVLPNNPALRPEDLDRLRAAGFDAGSITPSLRQALTRKRAEIRTMGPVEGAAHLVRTAVRRLGRELRGAAASLLARVRGRSAAGRPTPTARTGAQTPEALLLSEYAESLEVAIRLSLEYRPEHTEVPLVVVEAVGSGPLSVSWRGITSGQIAVHRSPGTHLDMLEHPWVRDTAALMDEALSST